MLLEIAGFVVGMLSVGSILVMFYKRQSNRAMDAIHASAGRRQRI
jgi:hypothetical protein